MKTWSDPAIVPAVPQRPARSRLRFLPAAIAALLIILGLETSFPSFKYRLSRCLRPHHDSAQSADLSKPFEWSSIEATEHLDFHTCYEDFECAKLKLPLDYFNGTYPDESISLAIAKLPARVPVDDPRYGGPILYNPGGPGGPGALFVLMAGKNLQTVVDSPAEDLYSDSPDLKYFDVIGFDPRGIGETEPAAVCMPDSPSAWSWNLRESTEGILGSSDAALGRLWSMTHAFGASCKKAVDAEDGPDIKRYMSTASVARDMLEITERHAEYVANRTAQFIAQKQPTSTKAVKYTPGTTKLQYWGFSYGTYLGSTFASMFPDRVGRVILDGVVSSDDYNHGLGNGSLVDAEKSKGSFYTFCANVRPEGCALATPTSTPEDVKERVEKIVQSLYHTPLAINSADGPELITYSDIKKLFVLAVYQPQTSYPGVAQVLAAIEAGGGEILDNVATGLRPNHVYSCPINGSNPVKANPEVPQVPLHAVLCGDGSDQTGMDIVDFEEYWHLLEAISPTMGSVWATLRMKCASWKINAVGKFTGEFGGETSHPILFISNTGDPVTPLNSGRFMSDKFPGSVVLIQDSAGHCSLSTPTACTLQAIRTYFHTGNLPQPNTLCIPPPSPFSLNSTDPNSPFYDPSLPKAKANKMWYVEDADMMQAAASLQSWAAENVYLGHWHLNQRVGSILRSLSKRS